MREAISARANDLPEDELGVIVRELSDDELSKIAGGKYPGFEQTTLRYPGFEQTT